MDTMSITEIVCCCLGIAGSLAAAGYGIYVGIKNGISDRKWRKLRNSPEYQRMRREGARMYAEGRRIIMRCQYCGTPKKHTEDETEYGPGGYYDITHIVRFCESCGAPYYAGFVTVPPAGLANKLVGVFVERAQAVL